MGGFGTLDSQWWGVSNAPDFLTHAWSGFSAMFTWTLPFIALVLGMILAPIAVDLAKQGFYFAVRLRGLMQPKTGGGGKGAE